MSRYDELVSIYKNTKVEYENDRMDCYTVAYELMTSILESFGCPFHGSNPGEPERDKEGFWNIHFDLKVFRDVQFPSSIGVRKFESRFMVRFEAQDKLFYIKDIKSDDLQSFYDFVFEKWKERLANYFHTAPQPDEKIELSPYL
jgi:hypothetical protein